MTKIKIFSDDQVKEFKPHWFDQLIDPLFRIAGKSFNAGWGDHQYLEQLLNLDQPFQDGTIQKITLLPKNKNLQFNSSIGMFQTSCLRHDPQLESGSFKLIKSNKDKNNKILIIPAGTGESFTWLREKVWGALLSDGYDLIIHHAPFYAHRRKRYQSSDRILYFSDQLKLVDISVAEICGIAKWAKGIGYGSVNLAGFSQGGFISLASSSLLDFPVSTIACATTYPSDAYVRSVFALGIDWDNLSLEFQGSKQKAMAHMESLLNQSSQIFNFRNSDNKKNIYLINWMEDAVAMPSSYFRFHDNYPEARKIGDLRGGHLSGLYLNRKKIIEEARLHLE